MNGPISKSKNEKKLHSINCVKNIQIFKINNERYIKCCYCNKKIKRSIVPHLKKEHPEKWKIWQHDFVELYNSGLSPQKIMKKYNTLFSWTVIENEIKKIVEENKLKLEIQRKKTVKEWQPKNFKKEETTIWSFPKRGNWAVHTNEYRGNWSPYVPRNVILQYSKKGDLVLDPFVGGGTTLIECWLLERNGIGVDISPHAINLTKKLLNFMRREAKRSNYKLPEVDIKCKMGDARNLSFINNEEVDLICTHPPYGNSLKYTSHIKGDLSHIKNVENFCEEMNKASKEFFRVLKPDGYCAILIGDIRNNGKIIPLGFRILEMFISNGFELREIIIKQQHNDRSTMFYRNNKLDYRIAHEYLFIFKKE
ncbi:site-specific DNA-methyltransferase [Candidatus Pacearchaeota archaeon]|nr:MAG: site-specific DNA-methyltransferase [Candidatus Pacearchaeota archaeon]